jgi:hypothetical protein
VIGGQWDKDHSTDMMHEFMEKGNWPEPRQKRDNTRNRWLHGDFRDVGYFFNHGLYENIVAQGGLK